jgi:hypothetical protein
MLFLKFPENPQNQGAFGKKTVVFFLGAVKQLRGAPVVA